MVRSLILSLAVLLPFVSLSAAEFEFSTAGVTAHVTPGATTYWSCACSLQAVVADTDGDGIVHWAFNGKNFGGIVTMIDGTSGEITTRRSPDAVAVDPLPFPSQAFLHDENGDYTKFVMTSFTGWPADWFYVMWVRPGVGAWGGYFILEGSLDDLPASLALMYDVHRMNPIDGSPAVPSGLLADDFFIVQAYQKNAWAASRVGPRLAESAGGGEIRPAKIVASEDAAKATITLARTAGTDGAASVHYETSDDTAHAGAQYQAASGTASFGNGQIFTTFEIPVIDDAVISSTNLQFRITLSQPSGATIATPAFLVPIVENDTMPVVTLTGGSFPEGDGEPLQATVKVTLDHSAPAPVMLDWKAVSRFFADDILGSGVVQFAAGEQEKTIVIPYTGDNVWSPLRRYTVSITKAVNAFAARTAFVNITEDDPAPVITVHDVTVAEGEGVARIPVSFSEPAAFASNIIYLTADGTAKAPADYTSTPEGYVFYSVGATGVTIEVPITNDSLTESAESFQVKVYPFGSGPLVAGTVTIVDGPGAPPPHANIANVTTSEGDGGAKEVPVAVTLSAAATKPVTLNWRLYELAGGATLETGVLSFSVGEKDKSLVVHYVADELWGANRELGIAVTSAVNATVAGEGRLTILEDESVPVLTVANVVVREGDGVATVRGTLSGAMRNALQGTYGTHSGTAGATADFMTRTGSFTIPAGETTFAIELPVVDDAVAEGTEAFALSVAATIDAPVALTATITILDDDAGGRRRSMRH